MTKTAATPKDRQAWILVALAKAGDVGLSAVQLQKVMFLLSKRRSKAVGRAFYKFEPYNYGPFSQDVYHDADSMMMKGLVDLDTSAGHSRRTYHLTDAGRALTRNLERDLPKEGVEYLAEAVPWAQSKTFDQLVRAIYEAYPEMRVNSVFQG